MQPQEELDPDMKQTSLRSTTAILVVLSLVQPLPMLAQSGSNLLSEGDGDLPVLSGDDGLDIPRVSRLLCAEEGITDALECVLFIDAREAEGSDVPPDMTDPAPAAGEAAGDDAEARARAAAQAEAEADAAASVAAEAEAEAAADARAREAEDAAREDAERASDAAEAEQDAADRAAEDAAAAADDADNEAAIEATIEARAEAEAEAAADAAEQAEMDDAVSATAQANADALEQDAVQETLAASDAETAEPEEVTSEVLTEDMLRSSGQEFQEMSAEELALQADEPASTRESGLSDLERAGLFGLGAVAVGAILLNNQRVQQRTGDRVIVVDDSGTFTVLKDDDALLRTPGSEVRTERFSDGSTRTTVIREDGTRIITVRNVNGRALRRVRIEPDGREYLLIDDTRDFAPVIVRDLPPPIRETIDYQAATDRETLRQALLAADRRDIGRNFSLRQVREIVEVRELAPQINLGGITFETNSAAIQRAQAEQLREMGLLLSELVRDDPTELFLVEGHTDAVGEAGYNLLLSDRRAESVARAFSEYFGVAAENLIVQGYGERFLLIPTQSAERLNRRVSVRRITALVRGN